MMTSPKRFRASRLMLTIGFVFLAYLFYSPVLIPTLADSGFLGALNKLIVIFLFILVTRQFFYLFFSVCEEIRRENLPTEVDLPPISVIVPAYNESVVIRQTVRMLAQMNYPKYEVIVVDDGSTDNTYQLATLESAGDDRIQVVKKPNSGKANSLNHGISLAKYEYIFCIDADSLVEPNALRHGVRHFLNPDVVAVAGSVLVLNQKNSVTRFQTMEYLTGLNFFKSAQSFLGLVTIIPGPSGLFRKTDILAVGGYQSDTFAEDCDLTLRLATARGRVVYEPYMEVRTEVPENLVALIKQRYRWNRGTLQAVKKQLRTRWYQLHKPHVFILVLYMALESFFLPVTNLSIATLSLFYQILSGDYSLLSLWLVVLVLLDLSVLLVALVDPRWPLRLIGYSIINRFTYSFFQDVIKILCSVEEVVGIRMTWGKLERTGSK